MSTHRRLWIALGVLLGTTFAVLLFMGHGIHRGAPPIPDRVVVSTGEALFTRADMKQGRATILAWFVERLWIAPKREAAGGKAASVFAVESP